MRFCTSVVLAAVLLSLLASRGAADPSLRLEAGATTARTDELASRPGFTLGGALALTRWAPLTSVAVVPQLELLFAHRNASAVGDGAKHRSPTLDVLELPLVLRTELTIGSHTFQVTGGAYASVLLRARTMDDSGVIERADTSSSIDVGWVAGGGLTLASLASGELSLEMRYQRGHQGFLLDGEGTPDTLSLLLGYELRSRSSDSRPAGHPGPSLALPSLALKAGLVATRLQPAGLAAKSAPSDYRPGFAVGGSYAPLRFGSWIALLPQVELSFVRRNAAENGPADSALTMDSIDLSLLARGELVASGRTFYGTFYGIGGLYGSLLFDAQRSQEGRITDMSGTISAVDAGWLLGAGFELSSIATIKPAIELRYQRGVRNPLPAGPGEVNQQSLSCLLSITYGGASPTGPQPPTPGALYSGNGDRATKTPSPSPSGRRGVSVRIGRPGDRWLDDLRFTRIARATRDGKYGYEVSYDIPGIAGYRQVVIFWPRDRIDFAGRSPSSRLETMKLQSGRLRYPQRITRRTLPEVHAGILQLEEAYAKQADGAISAMEGFAIVAGLGGLQPKLRAIPKPSPRTTAPRGSNSAASPAPTGAAARSTAARGGVWGMRPFARGRAIEQALGSNLPSNFPVLDRFSGGVATSIKSLDLGARTYQNTITLTRTVRGYIDSVAGFTGRTWGGVTVRGSDITGRALELAVPAGGGSAAQQAALQSAVQYGQSVGVTVRIIPY